MERVNSEELKEKSFPAVRQLIFNLSSSIFHLSSKGTSLAKDALFRPDEQKTGGEHYRSLRLSAGDEKFTC